MTGNTFGRLFALTSFGESHGSAMGGVVDGCPPGLKLDESDIQADLERRRSGTSRHTSQRREPDQVRILSGVFEGITTGTPIGLLIENFDQRTKDYANIKDVFRPGHADYTYQQKYGLRDYRGGGRASARETVIRVAAGAIARKYLLEKHDIRISAYLAQLGEMEIDVVDLDVRDENPFFCPDPARVAELEAYMDALRKTGESVGARVDVVACGLPAGLGAPVFAKLDADLAAAMMGIPAAKGVEVGAGFASVTQKGSEHRDEISPGGFLSNHAGGVLGGISSGQDLRLGIAFKPTSSLRIPAKTINIIGKATEVAAKGRHDPCVGFRAVPIVEAMMALVLMDHVLMHRAQNADATSITPPVPAQKQPAKK